MWVCYPVTLYIRAPLSFYVYGILTPCRPDLEFYVLGDQNLPRAPGQRDAYYHPTVDSSEEPFKWGLPDLDGLRGCVSTSSPRHYALFNILNSRRCPLLSLRFSHSSHSHVLGVPSRPCVFHSIPPFGRYDVFFAPLSLGLGLGYYRMLREELGWNQQKSDELLLPVIQRINKRGAAVAANKQSNLDVYFGDSVGRTGPSAIPRKRQAYTSKRLQKVVADYREEQKKRSRAVTQRGSSALSDPGRSEDQYAGTDDDFLEDFEDGRESGDHKERDPRSGSITGKAPMMTTTTRAAVPAKSKAMGKIRKTRRPSKVASTASRSTKRKNRADDSDDYDDEEYADADDDAAPVSTRPRPKPVRKKANTNSGVGSTVAG